jgi:hypothetical protein
MERSLGAGDAIDSTRVDFAQNGQQYNLILARLRVRGQLTELRAADLRFTPEEAADFLNRRMGLNLSVEDITALETRTEGWIAGLQLAALGIIFLGGMLYVSLRKQNEKIALVALGFYILEAALLAVSKLADFSLLGISQEYVMTGYPAYLQTMGNLALGSMDFVGSTLHMLAFCPGGLLFYYLLYKSGIVPGVLSLWGLIILIPCLAGTLFAVFGYQAPIWLYLPYIPFEFVIRVWILDKGIEDRSEIAGLRQVSMTPAAF